MRAFVAIVRLAPLFGALALGACATSVRLGGHDGGTPEPCGPVTCELGQVCCSESCGICVDPDEACIERSCGGPCDPFMAAGTGACANILGFVWNGVECVALSGCGCAGFECDRRYESLDECNAVHAECTPPTGCYSDADCSVEEFCSYPVTLCGAPLGMFPGTCEPRAIETTCPAVYAPVCGCDGVTYDSECLARSAAMSVLYEGPCAMEDCGPDDAVVTGDCMIEWGSAWNGMQCVPLVGCACEGTECPDPSVPYSCERNHAACIEPDLPCGDTLCDRFYQYCLLGADGSATCMPAMPCDPSGAASCACIPEVMDAMRFDCAEDGAGGVTVREMG